MNNVKSMTKISFKYLDSSDIKRMVPFIQMVNKKTEASLIESRLGEMFTQSYKCLGIFEEDELIGICGLWFMTRHYSGKSIEIDHVVIDESRRGNKIGEQLIDWLNQYCLDNNYEAIELNTYVANTASHKFYYRTGFEIKGFHFVKYIN